MNDKLKKYQEEAVLAFLSDEHRRGVIVVPTGAGRNPIGLAIATSERINGNVLWLAHREEVAEQIRRNAEGSNPRPRILSVQRASKDGDVIGADFGLVIVDEIEHANTPSMLSLLEGLKCLDPTGTRLLGFSSSRSVTPETLAIFDNHIYYEVKPETAGIEHYAFAAMADELVGDMAEKTAELARGPWPRHVVEPALGVIRAENLGPMAPGVPKSPYRVSFSNEAGDWQLAVKRDVKSESAATVLLEVEVLRILPANGMMLVLFKDAYLEHCDRPRIDGRINWITSSGPGYPAVWVPPGIVSPA